MPLAKHHADARLLSLRMAANSINLAQATRCRSPEQRELFERSTRARAEDEARRPFDRRPDLFKSKREREAMNEAYALLMSRYAYERPEVRARSARHFESWIARYSRPRMSARDIIEFCREAGAMEP